MSSSNSPSSYKYQYLAGCVLNTTCTLVYVLRVAAVTRRRGCAVPFAVNYSKTSFLLERQRSAHTVKKLLSRSFSSWWLIHQGWLTYRSRLAAHSRGQRWLGRSVAFLCHWLLCWQLTVGVLHHTHTQHKNTVRWIYTAGEVYSSTWQSRSCLKVL